MNSKYIILPFIIFLSSFIMIHGQEQKVIKGIVQDDTGKPINDVSLVIHETSQTTKTNQKGVFTFTIDGQNLIHINSFCVGYEENDKIVDLEKDDLQNIQITLQEKSQTLGEVVITAEKKETKLQKTPIAVSVVSSKDIEQRKINDMSDLVMDVPNFVSMNGGSPTLNFMSIRGILTFSTEPAIGVYIDGIPMFDGYASSIQLQDIERIEVLRGPQSTLYGRNALGGVINIITKQPGNFTKGFAEIGYGKYNAQEYKAGISTPIIKNKLYTSVNGFYTSQKGVYENEYTKSDYDNYKNYGANFYLKYLANERLTFTLNSKVERNDLKGAFPFIANQKLAFEKPFTIDNDGRNIEKRTLSITSLLVNYHMKKWELSSLTSFSFLNDIYEDFDRDYSSYKINNWDAPQRPANTWTQELKIVSQNMGKWNIVGGVFGFIDNKRSTTHTTYGEDAISMYPNAPYVYTTASNQKGKGFAAYANLTYAITEKWKLSAGLRYDYDEKKLLAHDEYEKKPDPAQIYPSRTAYTSANAVSPRLNLSFQAVRDMILYVNYAKGFRPGGVNQYGNANSAHLSYEPEYTNNYELGVKTEWLRNKVRANFSMFYTDWKDQQQTIMVPEYYVANIGKMNSKGLELEVIALPIKNVEVHYNLGLVNTKYDKLLLLNEEGTGNIDYKGNKQIFTPDFSSSVAVTYSGKISKDVGFFVSPEWKYLGKQYLSYYNDLIQHSFHLCNINAGIKFKNYEFKLWAKNITDTRYISFAYANYRGNAAPVILGSPATFGASAKINF